VSGTSHFSNDLGLDSLDTVEVVMAIEEVNIPRNSPTALAHSLVQEFSIEIPDKEADAIHSNLASWISIDPKATAVTFSSPVHVKNAQRLTAFAYLNLPSCPEPKALRPKPRPLWNCTFCELKQSL
ncbi:MAG: hypothetical protein Q9223_007751, partial [Gallowayella weberi]